MSCSAASASPRTLTPICQLGFQNGLLRVKLQNVLDRLPDEEDFRFLEGRTVENDSLR